MYAMMIVGLGGFLLALYTVLISEMETIVKIILTAFLSFSVSEYIQFLMENFNE